MDISIAPNLNAEIYRNLTQADRPTVSDKHLQLILVYDDNNAILGGSNMTDRFWNGTVWYYNDISDLTKSKALLTTKTVTGVTTGAYLEKDKFVIGEDSGMLKIIGLVETSKKDTVKFQSFGYACQHDDSLTSISVFSDKKRLVSGGMDCCIKVWDISNLMSTDSFHFGHVDVVTGVDVQHGNNSVFMSSSLDNCALMWDLRKSKPANCILEKYGYGLTSVSCSPVSDNIVAIGANDGSVMIIDIRYTNDVLFDSLVFSRSIHKLLFNPNPERSSQIACCCDDVVIKVLDTNKDCDVIYKDTTHTDFVRGLAWYKDKLISCSWDDQILKHTI